MLCAVVIFAVLATAAGDAEVKSLPGLNFPINYKQYSGYLEASDKHFLHYWFVTSQKSPTTDPLVIWMNGGPGCSSLDGLLSELGPLHVRDDGKTLYDNPYAWNKIANVLFLEAPAGVGFSYSTDGHVNTDDDKVSADNYHALLDFFAQYPAYLNNDLYITGESYGGIYVPTLAERIVNGSAQHPLKLKGIAVGNGMLSFPLNDVTIPIFAYGHTLIGENVYDSYQKCCGGCADTCKPKNAKQCPAFDKIQHTIEAIGLNIYDVYRTCVHNSELSYDRYYYDLAMTFPHSKERYSVLRNRFNADLGGAIPCLNTTAATTYLNQPDVRQALFIPQHLPAWSVCNDAVNMQYKTLYSDMRRPFHTLLGAKVRILVYHGDTDMACNALMGQRFVDSLDLPVTAPTQPWMVDRQVAGFVTRYRYVDFLTVKGAGHMVPQWRAPQALHMIRSFLNAQPY